MNEGPLPDKTQHSQETVLSPVGFELSIPARERPQNDALDCAATEIGHCKPSRTVYCTLMCRITFLVRIYVIYMNKTVSLHVMFAIEYVYLNQVEARIQLSPYTS